MFDDRENLVLTSAILLEGCHQFNYSEGMTQFSKGRRSAALLYLDGEPELRKEVAAKIRSRRADRRRNRSRRADRSRRLYLHKSVGILSE